MTKEKYNGLKVGDAVICNGFPMVVTRLCDWSDTLVEVGRGPNGACVDSSDYLTIQKAKND